MSKLLNRLQYYSIILGVAGVGVLAGALLIPLVMGVK